METEKIWIVKTILKKKSWKHHASDFKAHYKGTIIKTVWYWDGHKHTHRAWRNRIELPEMNLYFYQQLIYKYNKGDQNIQWRKDNLFNKFGKTRQLRAIEPN